MCDSSYCQALGRRCGGWAASRSLCAAGPLVLLLGLVLLPEYITTWLHCHDTGLLSRHCVQGGPASGGKLAQPAVRTITTSPPLELTAAHFCLNRSGTYAAVAGCALEDPEISRIVVVDLTNCRPAPALSAGGGGSSGAAPASPAGRHDICEAVVLDPELFGSRPGLRVLQVAWHPDSDAHLAVLTSGESGLAVSAVLGHSLGCHPGACKSSICLPMLVLLAS